MYTLFNTDASYAHLKFVSYVCELSFMREDDDFLAEEISSRDKDKKVLNFSTYLLCLTLQCNVSAVVHL